MVRDEEADLLEWVAYHSVLGFDTIIVADNNSSDRTAAIARGIGARLDVRLIDYPTTAPDRQSRFYEQVCRTFAHEFDWIAFLDGDEFLVSLHAETPQGMLERRERSAAVALGWMVYGSSGHMVPPPGLVIQNYASRAPLDFGPNRHVKSIVRPRAVTAALNPHVFDVHGPYTDVDGQDPAWLQPGMTHAPLGDRSWRVNHYLTRSAEHWSRRMRRRQPGNNARTADEFATYDRNEVPDPAAACLAPEVNALLGQLRPLIARR